MFARNSLLVLVQLFCAQIIFLKCGYATPPVPRDDGHDIIQLSTDPNDIRYFLFPIKIDPNNLDEIFYDNVTSLMSSRFDAGLPTVIIVHGFRSGLHTEICQLLKNAFLDSDLELNIVVIDWTPLSDPKPEQHSLNVYDKVVSNVPLVGERLGEFILFLVGERKIALEKLHLIGHSLGSHVSGIAGKFVLKNTGDKIARITGLDPAFPQMWPIKPERNLMKEDAHFVDVIHTNMGTLGSITQDGHVDFYPNGGSSQPGCEDKDKLPNMLGQCSHHFAYKFYASSVKENFHACPCQIDSTVPITDMESKCSVKCENPIRMGYHCPLTASGQYYLTILDSLEEHGHHNFHFIHHNK